MRETENCLKNNFDGDICGIATLGYHHIMGGNLIVNEGSHSSQVGFDLNAILANQDMSDQTDVLGQIIGKAEFKTKLLRLCLLVIKAS